MALDDSTLYQYKFIHMLNSAYLSAYITNRSKIFYAFKKIEMSPVNVSKVFETASPVLFNDHSGMLSRQEIVKLISKSWQHAQQSANLKLFIECHGQVCALIDTNHTSAKQTANCLSDRKAEETKKRTSALTREEDAQEVLRVLQIPSVLRFCRKIRSSEKYFKISGCETRLCK